MPNSVGFFIWSLRGGVTLPPQVPSFDCIIQAESRHTLYYFAVYRLFGPFERTEIEYAENLPSSSTGSPTSKNGGNTIAGMLASAAAAPAAPALGALGGLGALAWLFGDGGGLLGRDVPLVLACFPKGPLVFSLFPKGSP